MNHKYLGLLIGGASSAIAVMQVGLASLQLAGVIKISYPLWELGYPFNPLNTIWTLLVAASSCGFALSIWFSRRHAMMAVVSVGVTWMAGMWMVVLFRMSARSADAFQGNMLFQHAGWHWMVWAFVLAIYGSWVAGTRGK